MLIAPINKINPSFWDLAVITAQAGVPFESSETENHIFTKKEDCYSNLLGLDYNRIGNVRVVI